MGNCFQPQKPTKITAQILKKQQREEAIQRQALEELLEINVDMHFVFGDDPPEKKADVLVIKGVTSRNLWMENLFLFNAIKAFRPDAVFHPVDTYVLKWQPLGISYKLLVPLGNIKIQDDVLKQIGMIPPGPRDLILFYFTTANPLIPLFAPFIHPASLVSFREKIDVLNKLCDLYLEGKIPIADLQDTLSSPYDTWKIALWNILPEDWQSYHLYLKEKTIVAVKESALEKDYIEGNLDLQTYIDFKFPERKRIRDIMALKYPQPYTYSDCVICGNDKGLIQCKSCNNMACVACVENAFLNEHTKEGSFLLMHRRYCLKLGKILIQPPQIVQEPAYLRVLKISGRAAALERLMPKPEKIVEVNDDDTASIDEEELYQQELAKKKAQEELERQLRECPPELEHIIEVIKKLEKKVDKYKKEIFELQAKLDEGGHADNYTDRIKRLKADEINKLRDHVIVPLAALSKQIDDMKLTSTTANHTLKSISLLGGRSERLSNITSIKSYEKAERQIEAELAEPPPVDISSMVTNLMVADITSENTAALDAKSASNNNDSQSHNYDNDGNNNNGNNNHIDNNQSTD